MSTVEKVSIALSSELLLAVRRAVASGDYASSSEVVREALREWKSRRSAAAPPGATPVFPLSDQHRRRVRRLCAEFGVRRLGIFGSALRSDFDSARSDVDVAVEFGAAPADLVKQYFGLKTALEKLFERPVDLVELPAMPQSRLKQVIEQSQVLIHDEVEAA